MAPQSKLLSTTSIIIFPETREQYQKFGYDCRFMLGAFTEAQFLDYLDFKVQNLAPEPQACKDIKEKGIIEKKQDF